MIDDEQDEDEAQEIPLPNVKSSILAKVIEFANHHKTVEAMTDIEKVKWLFRFFGDGEFFFFFFNFPLIAKHSNNRKTETKFNAQKQPLKSANMLEVVQEWYAQFVNVEQEILFELILAANYMDIKPLLDLTCATVASMIKGKTPEEIRKTFNIVNDFTPEEEAQVREENKWCEEA
jgi:S-phase kinase-associated protein 1